MKTVIELLAMKDVRYDEDFTGSKFYPKEAVKAVYSLLEALERAEIKYEIISLWGGWKIAFPDILFEDGTPADVVLHSFSYGHERNLFESFGFPDDDDTVTGGLTIDDVLAKIERALKND